MVRIPTFPETYGRAMILRAEAQNDAKSIPLPHVEWLSSFRAVVPWGNHASTTGHAWGVGRYNGLHGLLSTPLGNGAFYFISRRTPWVRNDVDDDQDVDDADLLRHTWDKSR